MNLRGVRDLAIAARLRNRLVSVHINHKRIAASALLIGVLTALAKLFVAGREVAIAWRYGVSATADSYQLALTIVTWVPMFLAGAMGVVLVPRLVKLRRQGAARLQLLRELNGSALLLSCGVSLGIVLLTAVAARILASHLDLRTLHLTTVLAEQMAPVGLFVTLAGYLTARLQARERFSYTVAEAVPAVVIALLVAGPFQISGTMPLVIGTLTGFFAQLLILVLLVVRGDPPLGGVEFEHASNEWPTLYGAILMMALGQLLVTAATPVDQGFAARVGEGAVATLGYATRIVTLLTGLATVVVGRAVLPVLSETVANDDFRVGRRQALQWAGFMFCIGCVAGVILWTLAPELVRVLFERGAFGAAATAEVSAAVRFGAVQLPFYFPGIVLVQWYAATDRFRDILSITIAALALKVGLNAALAPTLGVRGIMLSSALMYAWTLLLMIVMLAWKRRPPAAQRDWGTH